MKKLSLLVIMLIALVSCEKEQLNSEGSLSFEKKLIENNNKSKMRIFYDHGGDDYGCTGSGGSCFDDVIVKPKPKSYGFQGLFDALYKNKTDKAQALFQEQFDYFSQYIDQEVIVMFINEELKISLRGNESVKTKFIIFKSANNNEVVAVYPISQ